MLDLSYLVHTHIVVGSVRLHTLTSTKLAEEKISEHAAGPMALRRLDKYFQGPLLQSKIAV